MLTIPIKCDFAIAFDTFFYRTQLLGINVIRFKLAEQMEKLQFKQSRRITIQEVADTTGVNRMTLSRMLNHKGNGATTETLDRLCTYFGCRVEDLIEHVPDPPAEP
jgi:putative transcriptional regulator